MTGAAVVGCGVIGWGEGLGVSGGVVGCLVIGLVDGTWEMDGFELGSDDVGSGVVGASVTGAGVAVGGEGDVGAQKHSSKKDERNGQKLAAMKPSKPAVSTCAQVSSG